MTKTTAPPPPTNHSAAEDFEESSRTKPEKAARWSQVKQMGQQAIRSLGDIFDLSFFSSGLNAGGLVAIASVLAVAICALLSLVFVLAIVNVLCAAVIVLLAGAVVTVITAALTAFFLPLLLGWVTIGAEYYILLVGIQIVWMALLIRRIISANSSNT